jgi:polyferredoxin
MRESLHIAAWQFRKNWKDHALTCLVYAAVVSGIMGIVGGRKHPILLYISTTLMLTLFAVFLIGGGWDFFSARRNRK